MKQIKTILSRNRAKIFTVASLIFAAIGLINLYLAVNVYPISNDECRWETKNSADGKNTYIEFQEVKLNGVTYNAGIRNGDLLLEINNVKVVDGLAAMRILNSIKQGEYARYTVKRHDQVFHTRVYIKKLLDFGTLGFNLLAFIWLMVGIVVLMAKPDGFIQRLFYSIGVLFIIAMSVSIININTLSNVIVRNLPLLILWDLVFTAALNYVAFMLAFFFFNFPHPFRFVRKTWVRNIFYWAPLAITIAAFIPKLFLAILPGKLLFYFGLFNKINIMLIVGLVTGLVALIINYRRLKSEVEKKPILVILGAYILGMLSFLYTSLIANIIADNFFNSPEYFTPIILIVLLPISFGYSIFKYQLMDVSVVVKKTIVYGTATLTLAVIYLLAMYGLGQGVGSAIGTEYRSAIAALTFVLFALVFQSTKDRFQDLLTRKFYPEQFASQQIMMKFSSDVVTIVGKDNILQSMLDTFVKGLRIGRFAILIREEETPVFSLRKAHGISDISLELMNRNNSLADFVREKQLTENPIAIERQQFEEVFPDCYQKLISEDIYTIVPMVMKGKIIGLLLFGLKVSGSQFSGKDLELLCAVANQAAVAIENARLYEAEAQKITLERDLTLAKRIQQSLLPKCVPDMKGLDLCGVMYPAMLVGGDYFDFIRVSENKLFVVVGDVSGKGLSASLYMTKLQTMMNLYCTDGRSPREILIDINRKIYESMERNWFITVSLALFDLENNTISFCRAGHSSLIEVENGIVREYTPKGLGLGLDDGRIFDPSLEEIQITYKPGNVYAFYSDGVTEAMNEKDELWGEENLQCVLEKKNKVSATEINDAVISSLKDFRGQRDQNDDITLVTLKIG